MYTKGVFPGACDAGSCYLQAVCRTREGFDTAERWFGQLNCHESLGLALRSFTMQSILSRVVTSARKKTTSIQLPLGLHMCCTLAHFPRLSSCQLRLSFPRLNRLRATSLSWILSMRRTVMFAPGRSGLCGRCVILGHQRRRNCPHPPECGKRMHHQSIPTTQTFPQNRKSAQR